MRSVFTKQIACLCLLLTLFAAYSFAAHQHSSALDEQKCTICVIAHSASPVAVSSLPGAVFLVVRLIVLAGLASTKQRLIPFALTVRPPPVS
jgi:hypothetical protein